MATGIARGAAARGKRIAFGDPNERKTIEWTHLSEQIFRGNPNIAPPGSEGASDLEWNPFRRGYRQYNKQHGSNTRWTWNYDFRPIPGEVFLTPEELAFGDKHGDGYILIEPNVASWKQVAPNKQWPQERFRQLGQRLTKLRFPPLRQFHYHSANCMLEHAKPIKTPTFRHALAAIRHARLVITGEGGMHHAAAAMGIPAVVIFGGFIPPEVTGYPGHENLAHGIACGNFIPCPHCAKAMDAITLDMVVEAAQRLLGASEPPTLAELPLQPQTA